MALDRIRELLTLDETKVERIVEDNLEWEGKIFSVRHTRVELPDGTRDWRELVHHNGGAGVCAVRDGKLCLVRQYRVALERMSLEIPAGKLDPGEDPAICAARELTEETGLTAERLEPLAVSAGAPGFNDEKTRIFVAHGLHQGEAAPDEGELVDVVWIPVEDVVEAIRAGLIEDAKTVVSAFAAAAGMA
ncbi:MAG: NUDIX hydrolase [Coriobacteriales bacterium]|nr:NUDIX hydrolase [Coriobacteriales bacterium]